MVAARVTAEAAVRECAGTVDDSTDENFDFWRGGSNKMLSLHVRKMAWTIPWDRTSGPDFQDLGE